MKKELIINKSKALIVILAGGQSRRFGGGYKTLYKLNNISILDRILQNFKKLKIINIGRLTDQKDQITLLKGLNLLIKKKINFRCCIIGEGKKKKELQDFIERNELDKNVKLMGYKTFEPFIDESYDTLDDLQRVEKIIDILKIFCKKTTEEKIEIYKNCMPILKHNQSLLLTKFQMNSQIYKNIRYMIKKEYDY